MKIGRWLMPAFAAAVGISFVAAEVHAASESIDFTGRARGWYVSSSDKANSDADSISNSQFRADSRLGMQIKTTKMDWTGSARVELEAHNDAGDGSYSIFHRYAYAQIENNAFSMSVGRNWMGDYCVTAYYPLGVGGRDCVGGLLGWTQGAQLGIKGLPVGLKFTYAEIDNGDADWSGFNAQANFKLMNASIDAIFESASQAGNDDRGGNDDATSSDSLFGFIATVPVGKITLSGGYESKSSTSNSGAANADDVDTGTNYLVVAIAYDMGNDMGVGAFFDTTTVSQDNIDDAVTNQLTVGFQKGFASTNLNVGYYSMNKTADNSAAGDGAASTGFAVGLQSGF